VWSGVLKRKVMGLVKSEVSFKVNGKPISFVVIHDLPNVRGLSFDDALNNWLVRTLDYTPESLCKYILSKNTRHIAMTEEHFENTKQ
jgi:hypothetical protein